MKILVVDDDPLHIDLLAELLKSQHHEIVSAINGEKAIELLRADRFDLIISDIEMPMMDGTALHSRIQQYSQLRNIPFIFLTGIDNPTSLPYFKDKRFLTVIQKTDIHGLLHLVGWYAT